MHRAFLPALTLLLACGPEPEPAPDALDEPAVFLFANFDADDDTLVPYVEALDEYARTIDVTLDAEERTFAPTNLTADDLSGITHPDLTEYPLENIAPIALIGQSSHPVADHIQLATEPNQVCIESSTTKYYARTGLTESDCFLDGDCTWETSNEVWKKNIVVDLWYDLRKDYRPITLSDGRAAMLARTWNEVASTGEAGSNAVEHAHAIELWAEHPDDASKTTRVYSTWFALKSALSEDATAGLTRNGLDEGMTFADEYLDGKIKTCRNDRDQEYTRDE